MYPSRMVSITSDYTWAGRSKGILKCELCESMSCRIEDNKSRDLRSCLGYQQLHFNSFEIESFCLIQDG
jgi:hypothetical protein